MLGTFPFELYFKSYCLFTEWSLEFSKIAKRPLSPSPTSLLCFSPPPTDSADAGTVERLPGHPGHYFASRWHPRVALLLLPRLFPRAGAPPAVPRAPPSPETSAPPPPRRCGGEPAAEATALPSRVPEHYKYPRNRIPKLFCSLLTPTPQNAAAAPPRTPASSTPPRSRLTAAPPPALTP